MIEQKWHKGPPPHVGWWVASALNDIGAWRWWNGRFWSFPVHCSVCAEAASVSADMSTLNDLRIEWHPRYPKGARVPRINPATGEVTGQP
jgi:hypothetical protein